MMEDSEQRVLQFADVLAQFSRDKDVRKVLAYFSTVSEKLRDTEYKLHLAELKLGLTKSSLEAARHTIQSLHEIATEAPPSQLRDDLTYFIDETKRRVAAYGMQL